MKLTREPLVHFILLGAVLAGVYILGNNLFSRETTKRIEITAAQISLLSEGFERQWRRPPTEDELDGLIQSRIREEVLYREALVLGMDQNDMIVRRRMAQKMDFLSQDLALLADPTEEELRAFFEEDDENYRVPPRITFTHVYFSTDQRGREAEQAARELLVNLRRSNASPERVADLGDRFMLRTTYTLRTPREIGQDFGGPFAETVFELEPGWHGPVASAYGVHLVHITDRVESRIPEFEDLRERLVGDFNRVRTTRAKDALFEGLLQQYEVVIDEDAVQGLAPNRVNSEESAGS